MKNMIYTPEIHKILKCHVWGVIDNIFIKRKKGTSYIETLELIDKKKSRLNLERYAILDTFYYDGDVIKAFGGVFYDDYYDFKSLYLNSNIDKVQVIMEVIDAVQELESIGVEYTDIHAKNIIVNSESHMRLVDLDEAHIYHYNHSKAALLLDIILESLLFYDMNDTAFEYLTPRYVIRDLDSKRVFSSGIQTLINGGMSDSSFYSKVDSCINELMDQEKSYIIRKELKTKYPHYF